MGRFSRESDAEFAGLEFGRVITPAMYAAEQAAKREQQRRAARRLRQTVIVVVSLLEVFYAGALLPFAAPIGSAPTTKPTGVNIRPVAPFVQPDGISIEPGDQPDAPSADEAKRLIESHKSK